VLEGYGSGAVDYLHKPVNAAVLRSKVAVFVDLHRKSREIAISNRALLAEVTERRRAEQQLQELNDNLDRLVTDRTQALKQLEAELRVADRRKDEFIATLAHELRNPLAPVRNAIHVLQRQSPESSGSQSLRDIIARQVAVMARLIDDLMDVSRINQGRIELQRELVDLSRVIELAVEASRPHIDEGGHTLTLVRPEADILIDADVTRLAQVFVNLLTNAAKYTDRGGRIELAVLRRDSEVEVAVKDNGIGIPAEHMEEVFVMFAQVEAAASRSRGGLGIGLSLVKHLVEMHGGRVEAHSPGLGRGSEFVVSLPLKSADVEQPPRMAGSAAPAAAPVAAHALKILVVDDNRDGAETLAELLSELGHQVRVVHDGKAAIDDAAQFRPDVMLLDIGLPIVDGYQVCRLVKQQPWGEQIVVVALSGWGDHEAKRKGKEAGFDRHLVKPVDEAALVSALADVTASSPSPDGRQLRRRPDDA
jgi:signal transduction histidine kinase/ActR/RegA family two-component response regulator